VLALDFSRATDGPLSRQFAGTGIATVLRRLRALCENVGEAIRVDCVGSNNHVDGFPQAYDLSASCLQMPKKLLPNWFPRYSRRVVDMILREYLFGRTEMNFDFLERETGVQRIVKETEKRRDFSGTLQYWG
jgi:hypothetical protein